jgi:hypothetical protein
MSLDMQSGLHAHVCRKPAERTAAPRETASTSFSLVASIQIGGNGIFIAYIGMQPRYALIQPSATDVARRLETDSSITDIVRSGGQSWIALNSLPKNKSDSTWRSAKLRTARHQARLKSAVNLAGDWFAPSPAIDSSDFSSKARPFSFRANHLGNRKSNLTATSRIATVSTILKDRLSASGMARRSRMR